MIKQKKRFLARHIRINGRNCDPFKHHSFINYPVPPWSFLWTREEWEGCVKHWCKKGPLHIIWRGNYVYLYTDGKGWPPYWEPVGFTHQVIAGDVERYLTLDRVDIMRERN